MQVDRFQTKLCSDGHRCFLASDNESVESEDIKHVLSFELILKHTVFICHPTPLQ